LRIVRRTALRGPEKKSFRVEPYGRRGLRHRGRDVLFLPRPRSSIRKEEGVPYIDAEARERLAQGAPPETAGELNYAISRVVDAYLVRQGGIRYRRLNEVIGVLECAKLELYRRLAAPYEDRKREEAGEVYRSLP